MYLLLLVGFVDYLSTFGIPTFDPINFALDEIRNMCFDVFILDDLLYEDVESFNISLELDTFVAQSGIIVNQTMTEICILDDDGKIKLSRGLFFTTLL